MIHAREHVHGSRLRLEDTGGLVSLENRVHVGFAQMVSGSLCQQMNSPMWRTGTCARRGDVRSSYVLEVTANEYTCQGLELDYVGVCWGGDLIRNGADDIWIQRRFIGSRWQTVQADDAKTWIMNKYRVLLTRARLATVIWVPQGDVDDATRAMNDLNAIAEFLEAAGARPL